MFEKIKKRDGKIDKFNPVKITEAISKAGKVTGEFDKIEAERLTLRVLNLSQKLISNQIPSVEEIQDVVEEVLLSSYRKTARSYILYRDQHSHIREIKIKTDVNLVDKYLDQLDWKVNENSNMTYSLQGLNNYVASDVSKSYWLNKIYTPEIKEAHIKADIHVHDLSTVCVYCVGWDLLDLLRVGFCGVPGKVESKPPKHFRSALGQVVNFFYTLQGESAGAVAFSNFDTLLAPFIRYDHLNYKETKQALQEFMFNMNVPTRVGFQTPFSNISLDLEIPSFLKHQSVVIGGKAQNEKYGDFQEEINMFNKALLELMSAGDAAGRVFTFPIPTYSITKDFDWDNPDLEGLWEMTAKYGIPYFSNFVNSDMSPEDARSMCCRLRIDNRELSKKGSVFGSNPLTGSVGVVTMNMAKLGYVSTDEEDFKKKLDRLMFLGRKSLEVKRKVLEKLTDLNLYPYSKFYLRDVKKALGGFWKNHFSTIGLVGMNEACLNLFGKNIATEEGQEFVKRILDFMRYRLFEYQKETGNNYNLEATPAEGTCYRLAKIDKKNHPDIICANEDDYKNGAEPYYTNSTHLPVGFTNDIFEAFDLQNDIQTRYTGGTVLHVFGGERIQSSDVMKNLVKKLCENYQLPYFTFTPTFSICPNHGYRNGEQFLCSECGAESEVFSRVVGYIRPVQQWNKGKQSEYSQRKTFKVIEELKVVQK